MISWSAVQKKVYHDWLERGSGSFGPFRGTQRNRYVQLESKNRHHTQRCQPVSKGQVWIFLSFL